MFLCKEKNVLNISKDDLFFKIKIKSNKIVFTLEIKLDRLWFNDK